MQRSFWNAQALLISSLTICPKAGSLFLRQCGPTLVLVVVCLSVASVHTSLMICRALCTLMLRTVWCRSMVVVLPDILVLYVRVELVSPTTALVTGRYILCRCLRPLFTWYLKVKCVVVLFLRISQLNTLTSWNFWKSVLKVMLSKIWLML